MAIWRPPQQAARRIVMKFFMIFGTLMAACSIAQAQVAVDGYFKKDGTYVAPHYRSPPDSSRYNNYSSRGSYSPYTGKAGTVDPAQKYEPPSYQAPHYYNPKKF